MIKAGKAQAAAWAFRIDLRRIGIWIGWMLFSISLLSVVVIYAVALSNPEWKASIATSLTIALVVGLGVSAVIIWGFTLSIRAIARTIDAYQQGVQDAVARLADAIPPASDSRHTSTRRQRGHLRSMT
ncbi:hypothetical protein [Micromonospora sp. NPDC047730]|uniref:hypothetical protein n=1 Tax=Micromonospora sp. NPDC047730 TaxID=3364253 RepID=UPI00371815EA